MLIKGMPVELRISVDEIGRDEFNRPIYSERWETVNNVIVSPASDTEITDTLNLYGKRAMYTLSIPKTDGHTWQDTEVRFFGGTFHTIGFPTEYMQHHVPLEWNKRVQVERIG